MAIASPGADPARSPGADDHEQRVIAIFAAHADAVFATCRRILRDREEAADACQETFLRALRSIDSIPDEPRPWLRTVARNYCYDVLRSRKRQAALTAGLARSAGSAGNPESQALDRMTLSRALAGLRPRDRAALWAALVEERPMAEVASGLGLSYMGAAQLVHRARHRALKLIRDLSAALSPWLTPGSWPLAGVSRAPAMVAGVLLPALVVVGASSIPDAAAAGPLPGLSSRPEPAAPSLTAPAPPRATPPVSLDSAPPAAGPEAPGAAQAPPRPADVPGLSGLPEAPGSTVPLPAVAPFPVPAPSVPPVALPTPILPPVPVPTPPLPALPLPTPPPLPLPGTPPGS